MFRKSLGMREWIPAVVLISFLATELRARPPQGSSAREVGQSAVELQVRADQHDDQVRIDKNKIYYGNPSAWTRAAVVKGIQVVKATPSWKKMQQKGIRKGDPAYEIYFLRAKKEAVEAIQKAAGKYRPAYDLVGEVGSIVIQGRVVPNITQAVLAELAP